MMGQIVMLAVGWGATELELLLLALDEAVGVEVGVESCRRINCPGCHIEGAHRSDALNCECKIMDNGTEDKVRRPRRSPGRLHDGCSMIEV
jgi:hypothetical protein